MDRPRYSESYGIPIYAALICWGLCLIWYPGILNNDSVQQYKQALSGNYNDFQPPVMSALWRWLLPLGLGHGSLFIINTSLYWMGLALIAHLLWIRNARGVSLLLLLGGLSPLLLYQTRFVITDVGLGSALVALFGIILWFREKVGKLPYAAWLFLLPVSLYALLIRANAAFAVVPLLLFAVDVDFRRTPKMWALLAGALLVATVPASIFVNRQVIGARDSGGLDRLPVFDLVGISYFSGSTEPLKRIAPNSPLALARCYTPLFWDTLMTRRCDGFWWKLPGPGSRERRQIRSEWIDAVLRNPLPFLQHRLLHFNSEVLFLVPAASQCEAAPEMHDCGAEGTPKRREVVRRDYITKSALAWPISWLVLGLGLMAWVRPGNGPSADMFRAMLASGILYGFSYFLVGVASNVRYFFWSYVAVQICVLLVIANRKTWTSGRLWVNLSVLLGIVALLGYAARFSETRWFV